MFKIYCLYAPNNTTHSFAQHTATRVATAYLAAYLAARFTFESGSGDRGSRRSNLNSSIPFERLSCLKSAFFINATNLWNALPHEMRVLYCSTGFGKIMHHPMMPLKDGGVDGSVIMPNLLSSSGTTHPRQFILGDLNSHSSSLKIDEGQGWINCLRAMRAILWHHEVPPNLYELVWQSISTFLSTHDDVYAGPRCHEETWEPEEEGICPICHRLFSKPPPPAGPWFLAGPWD
ncbi:unnamed protein product [Trichogramma brassicae]|uniref:Uncharacterized protein n=1 Tax=Trichogramma brassicae TaxID=86971 RepID=A0A6H5I6R6_9HYME|nr:unnamed protein product [Trichogramma brassicae]